MAVNPRRGDATAGAAGSPQPAESSLAWPGSQLRGTRGRGAEGATSFALRVEILGEASSSARLGLWELRGCGANPAS